MNRDSIVGIARTYIGKKEKPGNTGFEDKQMEADMLAVGWQPGWAWCAGFIEMVAWKAYPEKKEAIKGLFVPSAVNTFRNLVKAGYESSMTPEVGSFVFWQKMDDGKALWQGHCGIVSEFTGQQTYENQHIFKSIEGNTNSAGSREGDSVQEKLRAVKPEVKSGLKVIGFIKI